MRKIFFILFLLVLLANPACVFAQVSPELKTATSNVINNPNELTIESYTRLVLNSAKSNASKKDYDAAADDYRSALYFFRRDKNSKKYIDTKYKLEKTLEKLKFDPSESNCLEIAKTLFLQEKYFASANEFLDLVEKKYEKAICYEYLGDIAVKFKNINGASSYYGLSLKEDVNNETALFKLAKINISQNKKEAGFKLLNAAILKTSDEAVLQEAIKIYENEIRLQPTNEFLYENLGLIYEKMGDFKKTLELYDKAITLNPDDLSLKYLFSNILVEMGDSKEAIGITSDILKESPYDTQIRITRAKSYLAQNRPEDALRDYQVVLAIYSDSAQAKMGIYNLLKPKSNVMDIFKSFYPLKLDYTPAASSYTDLADMLNTKGQTTDAITLYKQSIETDPKYEKGYVALYDEYIVQGNDLKALEIAKLAYKNLPNSPKIKSMYSSSSKILTKDKDTLALAYIKNKQYDKAIAIYDAMQPKTAKIYEAIANCYKAQKKYDKAIAYMNSAIIAEPLNADLPYSSALIYIEKGDIDKAQTSLKKSLAINPDSLKAKKLMAFTDQKLLDAKADIAFAFYEKADYNNALVELNKIIAEHPESAQMYYYRALTHTKIGDLQSAMNDLRATIKVDRNFYDAYFELGKVLEQQGFEKEALREYEIFLGADVQDEIKRKHAEDRVIELGKKFY